MLIVVYGLLNHQPNSFGENDKSLGHPLVGLGQSNTLC